MYGFIRVASATHKMRVADIDYNTEEIIKIVKEAQKKDVAIAVFPELSITGYTCKDLFFQNALHQKVLKAIEEIKNKTKELNIIFIIGAPLWHKNRLYNCALILQRGEILGAVPKSFLPEHKEFYEKRWFTEGRDIKNETIEINREKIPFGVDLIFNKEAPFGVEICEDLWTTIPPSSYQAINGAIMHFNLSASDEIVGKHEYREALVSQQSARNISAYIYSSSGVFESTTDVVYSGDLLIAENGVILKKGERFKRDSQLITADIDIEYLKYYRKIETSYEDNKPKEVRVIETKELNQIKTLKRFIDPHPFVPKNKAKREQRCKEIFSIQTAGLAKRIEHIGEPKIVLGISGGLDSTLALLVADKTMKLLKRDSKDIIAVTMPGFGTTSRTYKNAVNLCKKLKVTFKEIPIKEAVLQHFKDIGQDPKICDVTYENAQARERTQILFDLANKENGIVLGTGDLSEIALGFATYGGDHLSMYNVNASIPKTLIRYVIEWVAESNEKIRNILKDIINTPVSPELLPEKNDKISQKTEEIIGPYELHDFFLFHMIKYGAEPKKILFLAKHAFKNYDEKTILKWLKVFIKRFFINQFKRSCSPDGPKVGSISLSPRGDWKMPSDASMRVWMEDL